MPEHIRADRDLTNDSPKPRQGKMEGGPPGHTKAAERKAQRAARLDTLRRLFSYVKPYYADYSIGICGVATANLVLNIFFAWMLMAFTRGAVAISSRLILTSVQVMALAMLAGGILVFFTGRKLITATTKVTGDIRDAFFHHVLGMPIAEIESRHSGDLLSRGTNDVRLAGSTFSAGFQMLANTMMAGLGAAAYMIVLDPRLGLLGIAASSLPLVGNLPFVSPLHRAAKELQEQRANLAARFSDLIQGAETIRTLNLSESMCLRVGEACTEVRKAGVTQAWLEAGRSAASRLTSLGNTVFIAYGAYCAILEPTLLPAVVAMVQLMNPVRNLFAGIGATVAGIQANLAAGDRVLEVLDIPAEPTFYEAAGLTPPVESTPVEAPLAEALPELEDLPKPMPMPAIAVEGLTFRYPDGHENALEQVSFAVPKGKTLAVVGPSGSGKTTLFKLLLGLYPPDSGDILVEGKSLFHTDLESWRQKFSYVPQDAFLFSGSVLDNVRASGGTLKAPDGGPSQDPTGDPRENSTREPKDLHRDPREPSLPLTENEEIWGALRMAHADGFVFELPDGIESHVGERGSKLSGGQRQRIAIARAVLKDAPVLLLDEATSSLDTESEDLVQEALQALMANGTCIVIAHRLSTVQNVHEIVYMEEGRIVERGTHAELMAYPGSKYRNLAEQDLSRT